MAANGRLPKSDLAPIPGGELRKDAAAAWNAPGGPADAGLVPTGPRSSYRTLAEQQQLYAELGPGIAAVPGTSNHGWGVAIDVPAPWMWAWLQEHGDPFGWDKTEAFHEAWHWNFVGGVSFPTFVPLKQGARGKRVLKFARRLAFVRPDGKPAYLPKATRRFTQRMRRAVREFQTDHGLSADGVIGPKTAAKINGVFRRQYQARHDEPRRGQHGPKVEPPKTTPEPKRVVWKLSYAARFIAKWEGFLPDAYLDTIAEPDVWTIGYGHTGGVQPGERWSKAKALRVLIQDIRWAAAAVARNVRVKLTVRQRIALISLVFNCGPGAIEGSTLQRRLNARDYTGAADELLRWSHAGDQVVQGLLNRRNDERAMFLSRPERWRKWQKN